MLPYSPEGSFASPPSLDALRSGVTTGEIFQAMCIKCDEYHNLHVELGNCRGIIPREETVVGLTDGSTKEYAILSCVGRAVCFQVLAFDYNGNAILSRRSAQEEARRYFLNTLRSGDIVSAIVQNPADFGVFCDIGCGYTALMRIDRCCVSRIKATSDLFNTGQMIRTAILSIDKSTGRIELTGRELLGTWEENADLFRGEQTVTGIVRSIMPYGIFIELTPNLSGLAEYQPGFDPGDCVSVFIRSINPEKHKVKLTILQKLPQFHKAVIKKYFVKSGHLDSWEYYPGSHCVTYF